MTAHRSRRRSTACAALAIGLCGTLALTGCNSHSKKSKKHSSSSSHQSKKHRIAAAGGAAGAGAAAHRIRDCRPDNYKIRFAQQSNPQGYVTVTFFNSSSTTCRLHNAPRLRFDSAAKPLPLLQGEPGLMDDTKVDVRPKSKAYAVIPTGTAAAKGTPKKTVHIEFMTSRSDMTIGQTDFPFAEKNDHISVGTTKVTNWNGLLSGAKLAAKIRSDS
ncbi:DUF4232 domain-containing protein [Streptomyces pinistramenti]|uniref:DUF4232 domain-containing protein n=1 Tax=Streptomyces pinistramenti TaxID=2884812 RepID=UPI001D073102|nr:DUF4232 domain-containing protein [Streptomyces pinistramenti]MCB5911349.1 DUF4232 domain-containing protein [Streptomyces pinistramenti]